MADRTSPSSGYVPPPAPARDTHRLHRNALVQARIEELMGKATPPLDNSPQGSRQPCLGGGKRLLSLGSLGFYLRPLGGQAGGICGIIRNQIVRLLVGRSRHLDRAGRDPERGPLFSGLIFSSPESGPL